MDDLVAQFLARGGKIRRVDEGERALDERAIYEAMREGTRASPEDPTAAAEARWHAAHDAFVSGDKDEGFRILDGGDP